MSTDLFADIRAMHEHYGIHEAVDKLDQIKLRKYLKFRANFIGEEYSELQGNLENPEEVVDALIDIIVVAIGTLDIFRVDGQKAWDEVLRTNMNKAVGVKPGRPNPLGLPDLMKPEGWKAPSHEDNHGTLSSFVCEGGCSGDEESAVAIPSSNVENSRIWYVHCKTCGRHLNGEDVLYPSSFYPSKSAT